VLIVLQSLLWADSTTDATDSRENPHGVASSCSICHLSTDANNPLLKDDGNAVQLCRSCHTSDKAIHAIHPIDNEFQAGKHTHIPRNFPLFNGRLSCLTCHDVTPDCRLETLKGESSPNFLRGGNNQSALAFCADCHTEQNHTALNVHDQRQGDRIKTDTCRWCHIQTKPNEPLLIDSAHFPVRPNSSEICQNCHTVAEDHPSGGPHLYIKPSDDMIWYISAYELHSRMSLSIQELVVFVRAAQRTPRSIPLDDQGRIICATCHNPHEEGLFRPGSDPATGAEPKQAVNQRLRAPKGQMCLTCHHL
jgi:hypothetical protein